MSITGHLHFQEILEQINDQGLADNFICLFNWLCTKKRPVVETKGL
jgi:hypothetical protein